MLYAARAAICFDSVVDIQLSYTSHSLWSGKERPGSLAISYIMTESPESVSNSKARESATNQISVDRASPYAPLPNPDCRQ